MPSRHQAAGVHPKQAQGLGVSVDHRRHNRSQESFTLNVQRLKEYKAKLIVFPRKSNRNVKHGDSSVEEQKQAKQVLGAVFPVAAPELKIKARKITAAEKAAPVAATLRKAYVDAKLWGVRAKRAVEKVCCRILLRCSVFFCFFFVFLFWKSWLHCVVRFMCERVKPRQTRLDATTHHLS